MLGCLKMYMLCTGRGRWNPRLRHTADIAGERVKDLWTNQVTNSRAAVRQHALAGCSIKSKPVTRCTHDGEVAATAAHTLPPILPLFPQITLLINNNHSLVSDMIGLLLSIHLLPAAMNWRAAWCCDIWIAGPLQCLMLALT